jgi:hypothetical protein
LARQATFFSKKAFGKCGKFSEYSKCFGECKFGEYHEMAIFNKFESGKSQLFLVFGQFVLARLAKFAKVATLSNNSEMM